MKAADEAGSFGEVWKATGPGDFQVALKFVPLAEKVGPVELRALEVIKDIRHPHLLSSFGAWPVENTLIVAMELAERTLMDRFEEAVGQGLEGIPSAEVLELFLDAAKGLDYLNEYRHPSGGQGPQGIQHCDVKPQNLLLVGEVQCEVADFGLLASWCWSDSPDGPSLEQHDGGVRGTRVLLSDDVEPFGPVFAGGDVLPHARRPLAVRRQHDGDHGRSRDAPSGFEHGAVGAALGGGACVGEGAEGPLAELPRVRQSDWFWSRDRQVWPLPRIGHPRPGRLAAQSPFSAQAREPENARLPTPEAVKAPMVNSIGMKLVLIPAGEFAMGSGDDDKDAIDNEKPRHQVRITRPFYLGATQVRQGQYRALMGTNPSKFKGSDELPVENVSWFDAIAFCNKLSEMEDLAACYRMTRYVCDVVEWGRGYRLPTEAEWEYACRGGPGGTTGAYGFGDDASRLGVAIRLVPRGELRIQKTHPVGERRPNGFGLYDMHGNVWEWCWDGYDAGYYGQSPSVDPSQVLFQAVRAVLNRGRSWDDFPSYARSASATAAGSPWWTGTRLLGFRVPLKSGLETTVRSWESKRRA